MHPEDSRMYPVDQAEGEGFKLPQGVLNTAQFTVRVTSRERREKLLRFLEKVGTDRLGSAVWIAIDHYLSCPEARKAEKSS